MHSHIHLFQKGARHVGGPSGPCHADQPSRPSGEVSDNKISPLPAHSKNLSVSLNEVIGLVVSILSLQELRFLGNLRLQHELH